MTGPRRPLQTHEGGTPRWARGPLRLLGTLVLLLILVMVVWALVV
ncbi:hypothetical protein [Streptomyces sp. NPDC049555]